MLSESVAPLSMVTVPPTERLPDAIGGPMLRAAAMKGDPTAAYEVGVRFAEGKGIAANLDEAAKWYDRAAQADAKFQQAVTRATMWNQQATYSGAPYRAELQGFG